MTRTLFSRMLITYLSAMLVLLALLGVTVSGMFQNQYISEKEAELRREADEINSIVATKYLDDAKRPVAQEELLTIARKYDALLQLYFVDAKYGRVSFRDEESSDKWAPAENVDMTESAEAMIAGQSEVTLRDNAFKGVLDIPVMTLERLLVDQGGNAIGAMFLHTDMSRTNASIKQVFMDVLLYSLMAVILAFLVVFYITIRITKPITDMNKTVMRFSKGDFDARVKATGNDEVGQLANSFNVMADELNTLEQARRSFVANVSHELRSPLTSMRGFLEAMQDGTAAPEDFPKYLDIVAGENKRMTGMVNDLLDLARIESGQYVLKIEAFDINELIIRTLLTFEARINAKRIEVSMDFEAEHLMAEADAGQIAQVIRNLVDNAIKFSPDGGKLTLSTRSERHKILVSVRDEGEGISPEDLPYVFDRFYKAEKAHTPSGSSTGLGLSIVKRIIEQHGESITVESPQNVGAIFTFSLNEPQNRAKSFPIQRR